MKIPAIIKISALQATALLLLLAQGCGFHLRGQLPGEAMEGGYSLRIKAPPLGRLAAELAARLEVAGAQVVAGEDADYVLHLSDERFDRRVLNVSAASGKVNEYELTFSCRFSISRADGELLAGERAIRISESYTFAEDAVLGKADEEEVIKAELAARAADQVMRALNAATRRRDGATGN